MQVRRAAAQHLGRYAEQVEADLIGREIIPAFQDLTQDGERAVLCISGLHLHGARILEPMSHPSVRPGLQLHSSAAHCAGWEQ